MVFDATSFQGDFFSKVLCQVQMDTGKKRAVNVQTLANSSSVEVSLNQFSLDAELMASFLEVGIPTDKAVVGMNDGCYANEVSRSNMAKTTDVGNRLFSEGRIALRFTKRFVVLCITHAL